MVKPAATAVRCILTPIAAWEAVLMPPPSLSEKARLDGIDRDLATRLAAMRQAKLARSS
jgi:hypothetical protein